MVPGETAATSPIAAEAVRKTILVTNHPYHYLSNARPDPRQQFFGTAFNMPELDPSAFAVDHPVIFELMQSVSQHFAIPETFLERP